MNAGTSILIGLLMAGIVLWELRSGQAWGRGRIDREARTRTYWLVLFSHGAILVAFLLSGQSWHLR
jgi:hypothetical protein